MGFRHCISPPPRPPPSSPRAATMYIVRRRLRTCRPLSSCVDCFCACVRAELYDCCVFVCGGLVCVCVMYVCVCYLSHSPRQPPPLSLPLSCCRPVLSSSNCILIKGSVLQYSIFLCTSVNSALTTAVVGCAKNVLTTVAGMLWVGQDYEFELVNSVGIVISMGGSFLYSWAKVKKR